jgi:hypothetical protein
MSGGGKGLAECAQVGSTLAQQAQGPNRGGDVLLAGRGEVVRGWELSYYRRPQCRDGICPSALKKNLGQ